MKIFRIKNRRNALATNSSSTHSVVYKNKDQVFEDLGIFDNRYYDRGTSTIAASREAKIRYIFANIFHCNELVEMMSERYPEMKEYYPLVKDYYDIYCNQEKRVEMAKMRWDDYVDAIEDIEEYNFGEHCRGDLYNSEDIHLSFKYLCNIIDSQDIVIVGGSDECDFVYDTIEGCQTISHEYSYLTNISKVKNGNYYILYGETFGRKEKMRLQVDSIPDMIPEYPELVDMKITNACEHKCPFCYMASTPKGQHADTNDIYKIVNNFKNKTEFALGGGNVLLHPEFNKIVKRIAKNNHIVNITIRYDDVATINENKIIRNSIKKFVSGIGISVQSANNIDVAKDFIIEMLKLDKHVSLHIIPEMIGIDESVSILDKIREINVTYQNQRDNNEYFREYNYCKVLFLGLKQSGRAKNIEHKLLSENGLMLLIKKSGYRYCVDTAFINTYDNFFKDNYSSFGEYFLTRHEGEYSMFIDAVKCLAFTSSYKDDGGIDIRNNDDPYNSIKEMNDIFGEIRKKNGFKVYEKPLPYYRVKV